MLESQGKGYIEADSYSYYEDKKVPNDGEWLVVVKYSPLLFLDEQSLILSIEFQLFNLLFVVVIFVFLLQYVHLDKHVHVSASLVIGVALSVVTQDGVSLFFMASIFYCF